MQYDSPCDDQGKRSLAGLGRNQQRPAAWLIGLLALATLATCVIAPSATAAPDKPSTAQPLQIGAPYSQSLPDRVRNYPGYAWLRLPEPMNPGDELTFAVEADTRIRLCLAPDADDFGQADMEGQCGTYGYTGHLEHIDLGSGKYRRTLKWSAPSSHGFLLVVGDSDCCWRVTTIYSVLLEGITRYQPDFSMLPVTPEPDTTVPPMIAPRTSLKLGRRKVRVNMTCPASEASPPCSGTLTLKTHKRVRFNGKRRKVVVGRSGFSIEADRTVTVLLDVGARKARLVRTDRRARKAWLIADVRDQAGNRAQQRVKLTLRP